eukprot:6175949-Pleurochrysis_carterae.AAC.4
MMPSYLIGVTRCFANFSLSRALQDPEYTTVPLHKHLSGFVSLLCYAQLGALKSEASVCGRRIDAEQVCNDIFGSAIDEAEMQSRPVLQADAQRNFRVRAEYVEG